MYYLYLYRDHYTDSFITSFIISKLLSTNPVYSKLLLLVSLIETYNVLSNVLNSRNQSFSILTSVH
nr:hypothetical protein Q903MT_gene1728 [Picea sitchensis]